MHELKITLQFEVEGSKVVGVLNISARASNGDNGQEIDIAERTINEPIGSVGLILNLDKILADLTNAERAALLSAQS